MTLTRIHRVMQFVQEAWLAPYIGFNTVNRQNATNVFEKELYKLFSNSVYGKALESLRRRQDVRIVTNRMQAKRLIARPTFDRFRIVSKNLTIVKMKKIQVYWNRPTYLGMCILDLSKLHMYMFHYDHIQHLYGYRAKLLFTDTDSLTYELSTDDAYANMSEHLSLYDTSDYPEWHSLRRSGNAKVLGKFKDECNGKIVSEFVGLWAKMYSLSLENETSKNAVRGIDKSFVRKNIRHNNFKHCLHTEIRTHASFHSIRSTNQQLQTICVKKIALSPYDDKRYSLSSGFDTLAYGHWRIRALIPENVTEDIRIFQQKSQALGLNRSYC